MIHRWGWTLVLNPDGTTTAWNPDRTKARHSHVHPPAPGNKPGPIYRVRDAADTDSWAGWASVW